MANSNFVDYVKIYVRSGHGGGGSVHFLRNALTDKGGPDGGDGGRGGHIVVRGNKDVWTLLHLKFHKHIFAEDGHSGDKCNMTGAEGNDCFIEVPLGSVIRNAESGQKMAEIIEDKQEAIIYPGGRGGKGNQYFKSSTLQAPKFSQPGENGQESWIIIELKVLADVGLVGFPNAGKSTLLSVLSAARPKIADYPFTTLEPNLGMVSYRDNKSFVIADIPGIIEGAHEGKGLGLRFLRHIERNSILLFMIPVDTNDIKKEYEILLNELNQFNPELMDKPRVLAVTKCDMLDDELLAEVKKELPPIPHVLISAVAQKGMQELKDLLWKILHD